MEVASGMRLANGTGLATRGRAPSKAVRPAPRSAQVTPPFHVPSDRPGKAGKRGSSRGETGTRGMGSFAPVGALLSGMPPDAPGLLDLEQNHPFRW
jgi:hypothetical protein